MVAFDLETTGVEPEEARIVTATVALVGGGLETEGFSVVVDPGIPIPDEAAAVHGYTTERVQAEGRPLDVALPAIIESLRAGINAGYALVDFNARFDLTIADRECRRLGIEPLVIPECVVDPLVIDKQLDRYRSGKRQLEVMCQHYQARLDGAHDALFDAVAAARLAWVFGERGRIVRRSPRSHAEGVETRALHEEWLRVRHDLPALHQAQRMWAFDEAVRLEAYFHEGNPAKDVPPQPDRFVPRDWPLIPAPSAEVDSHGDVEPKADFVSAEGGVV